MGRLTFVTAIPLLGVAVAAFNLWIMTMGGGAQSAVAGAQIAAPIFVLHTASGGLWTVSVADLLLAGALIAFFLDLVKSAADRRWAIVNHGLSMALFIICLVEMLLAPAFANSSFFLVTLMVLLDVLAGFIVTFAGTAD
jgi:hypothetical protein